MFKLVNRIVLAALLAGLSVLMPQQLQAQPYLPEYNRVFDDSRLPIIRIEIAEDALARILANPESDIEEMARFIYDDGIAVETVDSVGFRIRGNTSRASQKKSYKVSFNTFVQGRDFFGLEKMNLNGEHNDPSIVRSKLSWDIFQEMGLPASRANHVQFYVNEEYFGLYMNVEQVDERFLQSRFGNDDGFLYKCLWPADLTFNGTSGDNYKPGPDRRPYDLKLRDSDDEGYDDLAHFINVLNNTPNPIFAEEIEKIFDVNGFLRWMAVNVLVGMWDDYWFNQNNFYLYNDPATGRFVFIPFDYDNTFGIDWFGINWAERDVFTFGEPPLTGDDRPLADRILAVQEYRDRYQMYVQRVLRGPFAAEQLNARVEALHTQITPAAEADTFRTLDYDWDIDDFHRSFTEALGAHVSHGVTEYISDRETSAWTQAGGSDFAPVLSYITHTFESDMVAFTALVEDEETPASVTLQYDRVGGPSLQFPMLDDGLSGDRLAGDGIYGYLLEGRPRVFTYTIRATDGSQQVTTSESISVNLGESNGPLYINELMASNDTTIADEAGEFDDWVELYNSSAAPISLDGLFLSDDPNQPDRWALPAVTVPAQGFLLLWLDNDPDQGDLHGPFRLERNGEEIGLYEMTDGMFSAMDLIVFNEQRTDTSYGRSPDGGDSLAFYPVPTPGASNVVASSTGEDQALPDQTFTVSAFPNPFANQVEVQLDVLDPGPIRVALFDLLGRNVTTLADRVFPTGKHRMIWRGEVAAGMYILQVERLDTGASSTRTLIRAQ